MGFRSAFISATIIAASTSSAHAQNLTFAEPEQYPSIIRVFAEGNLLRHKIDCGYEFDAAAKTIRPVASLNSRDSRDDNKGVYEEVRDNGGYPSVMAIRDIPPNSDSGPTVFPATHHVLKKSGTLYVAVCTHDTKTQDNTDCRTAPAQYTSQVVAVKVQDLNAFCVQLIDRVKKRVSVGPQDVEPYRAKSQALFEDMRRQLKSTGFNIE